MAKNLFFKNILLTKISAKTTELLIIDSNKFYFYEKKKTTHDRADIDNGMKWWSKKPIKNIKWLTLGGYVPVDNNNLNNKTENQNKWKEKSNFLMILKQN